VKGVREEPVGVMTTAVALPCAAVVAALSVIVFPETFVMMVLDGIPTALAYEPMIGVPLTRVNVVAPEDQVAVKLGKAGAATRDS
jgi:hypothetical protein